MKRSDVGEGTGTVSATDAQSAARTKISPYANIFYWPPFWFFIFLAVAVSVVSYAAILRYSSNTRQDELKLLSTIADLKVDEITKWRKEREGDAEFFSRAPFFVQAFEKWQQQGEPHDENRQLFVERMNQMQRAYGYQEITLFDAQGRPVLSNTPDAPQPAMHTMELIRQAIQTQTVIFLDFSSNDIEGSLDVITPIMGDHGGQAIGAAFLQADTSRFLFSMLKASPLDDQSTELVLVHRDGDDVLFLNNTAANATVSMLRQPLNKSRLPSAMAVSGMQEIAEGVDYRGVPVFAALHKIPGSDWALVVKVDQEKIYAPLRNLAWLVAGAVTALIVLSGLAVSLWWRSQCAEYLLAEKKQAEKNLRNESVYARSLIEASLDPLVTISAEGKILDVNKATEEATGISRSKLIGTSFSNYFTEPEKAEAGYRKVFARGFVRDYPLTLRHASGRAMHVLYNATTYRDDMGNVLGVFAAARDITERKQVEESLIKSQRLLVETEQVGKVGGWEFNIDTLKLTWTEEVYRIHEVANTFDPSVENSINFYTHASRPVIEQAIQLALSRGEPFDVELEIVTAKGNLRSVHTIGKTDVGQRRVYGFFQDITERKRAEKLLRDNESILRYAQRLAHLGHFKYNPHTSVVEGSDELFQIFGLTREQFQFSDFVGSVHPDDLDYDLSTIRSAIEHKTGYEIEHRLLLKDATLKWIRVIAEFVSASPEEQSYLIGVAQDITERKRDEEKIRQLNSDLERRVAERTAELEAFAYSVSHDLRVPLRAVDGFSRLLLRKYEGKLDEEGKRLLNVVRNNARKMGQLIDDILAFSRAGRLEVRTAVVDMTALVREAWKELEFSIAGRDVHLEIKHLPKVQGDPAMLRQVWINLLSNAIKFTSLRTTANIEIGSAAGNNEYTFYVKDNGAGFDQQYVHKLFGVFQRLHSVAEFEGTGIGLAIVKCIITRHGGRVWAEGKVNEGALVYFTLPVNTGKGS